MPRVRVTGGRRRVAKACTLCQTDKKKCDGLCPCGQCIKRERSDSCTYSSHKRVYGRQRRLPKDVNIAISVPTQINSRDTATSFVGQTNPQSLRPLSYDSIERNNPVGKHITIPKLPNFMRDTKGRASTWSLIY
jgi:hypothetical protein